MDINAIMERIKNIILRPASTWETIKTETKTPAEILTGYLLPLVVLSALTALLGSLVFSQRYSLGGGIGLAVMAIVIPLVSVYLAALVINELAGSFSSRKDFTAALKLVAYSYTASLVASIVANLHWSLSWIGIFGLYSIYLFWTGVKPMMETPEEKKVGYVVVSALVLIVIWFVLGVLLTPLILVSTATTAL